MAEEFASFLENTRKAPLEEKLNAFGDIVEKIMQIVLRIPDLVDQSLQSINSKVANLQTQVNALNNDLAAVKGKTGVTTPTTLSTTPSAPISSSLGSPPGGPPPPPAGPPGGPPGSPPGGPPGASRPASPVSLRGAIMSELKELFNRRKSRG
jgi:hypothetical protein